MTDSRDEKTVQDTTEKLADLVNGLPMLTREARLAVIAKLIREAIKITRDHQWIATSERLPENRQVVLTWHRPINGCCFGHCVVAYQEPYGFSDVHDFDQPHITHWLPLPSPPSREQQ